MFRGLAIENNGRYYQPPHYRPPQPQVHTSAASATHHVSTPSQSHAPTTTHTDTLSISNAAREKLAQHLTAEDKQLINKTYVALPGDTQHYGNNVTITAGVGYAHVDASAHAGNGLGFNGTAQATVVKGDVQANSKHVSGGGGFDVGNVEAHAKVELNQGVNATGSIEADVADVHANGKLEFQLPFVNKTVEIDASGKALFGVGASGHAALNGKDGGFHAGFGYGVALGPGFQWSVDLAVK